MKKGRLFKVKVYDKEYMVPKYIYDSYNLYTYHANQKELAKLREEIQNKYHIV